MTDSAIVRMRLAAERAVLARLCAGYGFATVPMSTETYLRDESARERLGRDALRPQETHAEQLTEVESALARSHSEWRSTSKIAALAGRLGLDELETDILSLAVGFALDPDVRSLCSVLSSALPARRRSTLSGFVFREIFSWSAATPLELAIALGPSGKLRRFRLISATGDAGLGGDFELGPDVLESLAGERGVPDALSSATTRWASEGWQLLPSETRERIAVVAGSADSADSAHPSHPSHPSMRVVIHGPQGSGKRAIAEAFSDVLKRPLLAIDITKLEGDDTLLELLAVARQRGLVVYLAASETIESDRQIRAIDRHDDVVLFGSRESSPLGIGGPAQAIFAPRPTIETRVDAWREGLVALTKRAERVSFSEEEAETLGARYVIGVGAIAEVLTDAMAFAGASDEAVTANHLEDAVSRRLSLNLGVLGQRITRQASFDEMVLPTDVVETIRDLIAMVKGRSEILESWGYERHLGISRGVAALFSGGPGTGKTMAASVVSSELGLELFRIDLSSVVSKWVGETEKNLARIFDEAQDAHAMLLFDEADSLFGKRTDVQSASDRYANLETNYVLQRMEQFDGISILTTNLESGIDAAFMRRLNFRVRFPDPEEDERAELWRRLIPPGAGLGELDVSDLAERFEMTGGHIRNAIVRAAVVASREGRRMVKEDLERGAQHEYYELGKVMHSSL